jgi:hypothetical protein
MRIFLAVAGTIALVFGAGLAMLFGILVFTPTGSCDVPKAGACAFGQLPMKMMLFGTPLVVVGAVLTTWVKAMDKPRAEYPYVGLAAVVLVFVAALTVASAG